jgi:alanine racemase
LICFSKQNSPGLPTSTYSMAATVITNQTTAGTLDETAYGGVLEIDLDAVAANWQTLRVVHAGDVAAVLKANAYGIGAEAAASRLFREGCRHFFVAHFDEALTIRDHVPGAMLAVLNGLRPGTEAEYVGRDILPVIGSLNELSLWSTAARHVGRPLPALLHIDTGMARLGLDETDVEVLAHEPERLNGVSLRYVMTHLVSAEMADDARNPRQLARFAAACLRLGSTPRSLANSSGIFLGPAFASDLARPGAALYGVNPTPDHPNPMRAVVRLRGQVLQTREVPTGESVGYNATWTAERPSRIATVGIGYADGWLRSLSGRGTGFFDGKPVPLVGRVSMDLTTFDITDHETIGPGAWIDFIGPDCPVDRVASEAGTNGYEILTSLGQRYARKIRGR